MKRKKVNKRIIHRKVAALSAIPLLITLISGTAYSILQPLGIDAFWLIKWHTGNFGIFNLQPFLLDISWYFLNNLCHIWLKVITKKNASN